MKSEYDILLMLKKRKDILNFQLDREKDTQIIEKEIDLLKEVLGI